MLTYFKENLYKNKKNKVSKTYVALNYHKFMVNYSFLLFGGFLTNNLIHLNLKKVMLKFTELLKKDRNKLNVSLENMAYKQTLYLSNKKNSLKSLNTYVNIKNNSLYIDNIFIIFMYKATWVFNYYNQIHNSFKLWRFKNDFKNSATVLKITKIGL